MALPLAKPLSASSVRAAFVLQLGGGVSLRWVSRLSVRPSHERESRRVNKTSMQASCTEEDGAARPVIIRPSMGRTYSIIWQKF